MQAVIPFLNHNHPEYSETQTDFFSGESGSFSRSVNIGHTEGAQNNLAPVSISPSHVDSAASLVGPIAEIPEDHFTMLFGGRNLKKSDGPITGTIANPTVDYTGPSSYHFDSQIQDYRPIISDPSLQLITPSLFVPDQFEPNSFNPFPQFTLTSEYDLLPIPDSLLIPPSIPFENASQDPLTVETHQDPSITTISTTFQQLNLKRWGSNLEDIPPAKSVFAVPVNPDAPQSPPWQLLQLATVVVEAEVVLHPLKPRQLVVEDVEAKTVVEDAGVVLNRHPTLKTEPLNFKVLFFKVIPIMKFKFKSQGKSRSLALVSLQIQLISMFVSRKLLIRLLRMAVVAGQGQPQTSHEISLLELSGSRI